MWRVRGEGKEPVDLQPNFERWHLSPRNQEDRGTCPVFATVGIIEYELARVRGEHTRLSVEYLNWAANGGTGHATLPAYDDFPTDQTGQYEVLVRVISQVL